MPARYRLIAMTFLLSMLLYVDRIAISTAKAPITGELDLTDQQFGWVLSAFALGYAMFQAPAGALADRFGARSVLASIVLVWSIFTGLTGLVWSFAALLVCRFLFGAGEAGAYPTCARAFYSWLPAGERGLAQGINFSGSRLGSAFALPLVAWFVTVAGWREAFIALGAAGIVFAAAWWLWFRDWPEDHPGVSQAECALIVSGRGTRSSDPLTPLSGRALAGAPNLWIAMGQYFASNFTFFFCLTWLFPYLQKTYHLEALQAGLLSSGPLLAGATGNWIGGWLVDRLYTQGRWATSRRVPAILGFVLAAIGLLGSLLFDGMAPKVICLSLAIFGADMTLPPSWAFCIDIGRRHVGAVSGMMNMAGNTGSFVTSLAFPYLLALTGSPAPFFIVGAMLNLLAAGLWIRARPDVAIAGG